MERPLGIARLGNGLLPRITTTGSVTTVGAATDTTLGRVTGA
ncbi:hypothetical protein NY08_5191 [Rhodococcus sp. B7740]|nr:hypothetical protein NY08_5191 [Rhodococcus sp. B7740]